MSAGQSASEMAADLRARARALNDEADNWEQGAAGEREVGAILDRLPAEYVVFHDLQIPGSESNVDHLVIGPNGVFTVDTKKYTYPVTRSKAPGVDKIWTAKSPIRVAASKWETAEVERLIGTPAKATMCIIAPSLPAYVFDFDGVRICHPKHLIGQVTTPSPNACNVADVAARVASEFGAIPENRQLSSTRLRPAQPAKSAERRFPRIFGGLLGNAVLRIGLVGALAFGAINLLPFVVSLLSSAGTAASEQMLGDLVPTTVITTPATTTPATATPTTAPIGSPPAVSIEASCVNPGMGWVASFAWPGDLPEGAAAYSIRWQLDGAPIIRHDIGGWTDPTSPPTEMLVADGAALTFFTDYLDDDGQVLASTERPFEVASDC